MRKLVQHRDGLVKVYIIQVKDYKGINEVSDWMTPDGRVIPNTALTSPADEAMSYAYCSDTVYDERVARSIEGVHTVYHEATYTDEYRDKARQRGHSTASEAARIALSAGAKKLVLGHFSKRYLDESQHLKEAQAIFPDAIVASEGLTLDLL